jgi:hypothetical protein
VNSKSATRLFYRPFSYIFFRNFGIKLLVLYCRECHFKNKLVLSLPKFFLQLVFKIHFKTFTNIPHSQWFIDILGTSICPLRTADQLERMTLETRALATRNKQSINFQYDIICQTKDYKDWYYCFSTKHAALRKKNQVYPRTVVSVS